ncbi:radical SAM domain-containing iron-sulfur cluster-binding oxidoreductase [Desulfuromonas sp. DDH964]|uniref:B12-binding domain-containing radical SAM protein n=1 Tax=Desulfuromonas sp. DDH964 TaxID=1823759 RepID=UPI00078BBCA6|nr:radical SAM protein [Desulfuromonas sp. DDH964]AMV71003.1 radical SAM domain-containing iron-sulfur cluster-binding oxidoreductase [Desulfuromonas sp. DDH964]
MKIVFATLHVRPSNQSIPLAAGCLAAALPPKLREQAVLYDFFPGESPTEIAATLVQAAPQLVCIPLYSWNRQVMVGVARLLRQALPAALLVAGGPEATAAPEALLAADGFQLLVRGEGEAALAELCRGLAAGEPPAALPGLSLLTPDGIIHGPERTPALPTELPSPWLTGVLRPTEGGGILWETARGCPFACDYCYDGRGTSGVRHFPAERLQAELRLFARSGASQVWVLDSSFNVPAERGRALLELARREAPHLQLHLEAKAEFLDRSTARLLGRQPCSVQLGLQSFDHKVLRHIHRRFDPQVFRERVDLLSQAGATFGFDLIYGLPGDNYQGFAASLEQALALRPNHLDLFPLALLPGTTLHQRRAEFGLQADPDPPYLLQSSTSMSAAAMEQCRHLAAATDLFYNLGRAVAFFPSLLQATGLAAVAFLEQFATWLLTSQGVSAAELATAELWPAERVAPLQEEFVSARLAACGRGELWPAAQDLLRYHYHYAETLLGAETLPANPEELRGRDLWTTSWRTAPTLRLVPFHYEILDLQELAEPDLQQITELFRPVGSTGLFLRRGSEVLCESLEEAFLTLLRGSNGRQSPETIYAGSISRGEGEEIVEFAVAEGLLLPPEG